MSSVATRDYDAGGLSAPAAASDPAERSFAELIAILGRRLPLIASVAGIVVGAALFYTLVATRLFTASAVVLLEPRSSVSQADGLRYSFASDSALVDSQMKLLSSETVLRRAVEREGLQEDPEFGSPSGGLWQSVKKALGLAKDDAEQRSENIAATVYALSQATTVKRPERTYVMEVSVVSRDAKKAARLANAVAEAYIADQTDARSEISRREQDYLEGNISQLRQKIEKAENDVEAFKQKNGIVGASGKLVSEQLLTEVNTELAAARTKTSEAKARYDQVRQIIASGKSIETAPDALKSPVIDKLRSQFAEIVRQEANAKITLGDLHPQYREIQQQLRDTKRLISEELGRIAEGARNDMRAAEANEANIARQVDRLKQETTVTNQAMVQLRELEREVDTNKSILDNLLKAKGNVTRDSVDTPIARVIARAAPPLSPSSPRRVPIMLLATAIGLGLGVAAAFAMEGLRPPKVASASPLQAAQWTPLLLPASSDPDYVKAIADLTARAPVKASSGDPGTLLFVNCGAPFAAEIAMDISRAALESGRSVLLIELSARAGGITRAAPRNAAIGVVEVDGVATLGILAAEREKNRLVIAPGAFGQRGLGAPSLGGRAVAHFGRASDFDLVVGYAPDSRADRNGASQSGLVIVAIANGQTIDDGARGLIESAMTEAPGRCVVLATGS
ncbi:GumC family protein [Terrarubrum flagellatum]|uniref:GumC family protein n=1 Tax=Terrirubrum flagellatum TaxID=2895980 RepID=UPI0031454ACD